MPKRYWKKRWAAALLVLMMTLLTACHPLVEDALEVKYVSATFYPLYALTINITRDVPALSVSCLTQPQDGCLRSYQLSDWDYAVAANQDVIILGGRGLESFESTLMQLPSQPILLSVLEGMQLRRETSGDADDENTAHFTGENPWPFLSVAGAMEISISIAADMAEIDEAFAQLYHKNLEEYLQRLNVLIGEMSDEMASVSYRPVAVLHEGLTYFTEQFGLNAVLIYPREPGSDLADNDLEALLAALAQSGAKVVFIEEQAPAHLVRVLEENGYPTVRIDTLSAHRADGDLQAYERIMLENARRARAALERAK